MQTCCCVLKLIFFQLKQYSVLHAPIHYQRVKTTLFMKTFLFLRISSFCVSFTCVCPTSIQRCRQLADWDWLLDSEASYTLITKHHEILMKCEKWKVYSGVFYITSISHQGRHLYETSKDFMAHHFAALMKHEIWMKNDKCIASFSLFAVPFCETVCEIMRNAKNHKCIVSLTIWAVSRILFNIESLSHTLSTHFEPLNKSMYHVGLSDGTVSHSAVRLKIYGTTNW